MNTTDNRSYRLNQVDTSAYILGKREQKSTSVEGGSSEYQTLVLVTGQKWKTFQKQNFMKTFRQSYSAD